MSSKTISMKFKYLLVAISLMHFVTSISAQEIRWNETKYWKLYRLNNKAAFNYPVDTLQHFESRQLNDSAMHRFLSSAVAWPANKKSVWMGVFIATYETTDGILRKVSISTYGGFLFEESSKRYYQVPERIRNDWMEYLNVELDKLFAK